MQMAHKMNIYIFLFDGFSDWEISYVAPELQKSERVVLKYFTTDGAPVTSMGGLQVTPHLSLEELNAAEVSLLILPGGTAWETGAIEGLDALVEKLYLENKTIAAICAATTYLGQRGYLDEVKHTSNALAYLQHVAPDYKGAANYQEHAAVSDQNIITANGTMPIEFAREIFKKMKLYSEEDTEKWFQLFKNGTWVG